MSGKTMDKTIVEMKPEVCEECAFFCEETIWPHDHIHQCRAHAPMFTKHSNSGVFPSVEWNWKACGEAVARDDIASVRDRLRMERKIREMKPCKFCHEYPYSGRRHPEINTQPLDDGSGVYMWCPNCNTIASGANDDEMIDAWNRGEVVNYDNEELG